MPADAEIATHSGSRSGDVRRERGARDARPHPARRGRARASPRRRFPVRCTPGDNLAVHVAVARAQDGDVLVVDVGDFRELGYWGEVLTTAAQARGVAGLVIDGGVRDVSEIQAHGFPVFSTMIALRGAGKNRPARWAARSPAVACSSSSATGSWAMPTASWSCPGRRWPT